MLLMIHVDHPGRTFHRSASNAICHGSLPVYISRSSTSSSEVPAIPPLARQSTLSPSFRSRVTSGEEHQPGVLPQNSRSDTRSSPSQPCDAEQETRLDVPFKPQGTFHPREVPRSSRSPQPTERAISSMASISTLVNTTHPTIPFFGRAS